MTSLRLLPTIQYYFLSDILYFVRKDNHFLNFQRVDNNEFKTKKIIPWKTKTNILDQSIEPDTFSVYFFSKFFFNENILININNIKSIKGEIEVKIIMNNKGKKMKIINKTQDIEETRGIMIIEFNKKEKDETIIMIKEMNIEEFRNKKIEIKKNSSEEEIIEIMKNN